MATNLGGPTRTRSRISSKEPRWSSIHSSHHVAPASPNGLSRRKPVDGRQRLIELLSSDSIRGIFAETLELRLRWRPQPDTEYCPAARKVVEGHDFSRQLPGSASGSRGDQRTDAKALRD